MPVLCIPSSIHVPYGVSVRAIKLKGKHFSSMRNSFPTLNEVAGWMTLNNHLCLSLDSHLWLYNTHYRPSHSFLGTRSNQPIKERREQRKLKNISMRKWLSSRDYSVPELLESHWWDVKIKQKQCWKISINS